MPDQPTLFQVITVHCFACSHTVEGMDPTEAHDLMEAHYATAHVALIARLVGQ